VDSVMVNEDSAGDTQANMAVLQLPMSESDSK